MVDPMFLFTVVSVEEGMLESGVMVLPPRVELVELIGRSWV